MGAMASRSLLENALADRQKEPVDCVNPRAGYRQQQNKGTEGEQVSEQIQATNANPYKSTKPTNTSFKTYQQS
jgi:hypothetical protein